MSGSRLFDDYRFQSDAYWGHFVLFHIERQKVTAAGSEVDLEGLVKKAIHYYPLP